MAEIYAEMVPAGPDWRPDWEAIHEAHAWARAMEACPQDPIYHAEGNVWIHTRMVGEVLLADPRWRALARTERREIFWTALLHDVAKPTCTREQPGGRYSARGHSTRGARDARRILWRLGAPFAARERICAMIVNHQVPFHLIGDPDADRRAIAMSQVLRCDHLALVTRADGLGRHCEDQAELTDNIALFEAHCEELGCLSEPFPFANDHSRFQWFRTPGRDPRYAAHDDTRCTVTLLSGLPACGKDTWVSRHAQSMPVISLDALRVELKVDPRKHGAQGTILREARERAKGRLRASEDFVWNATNISRDVRARTIDVLADYNARVKIVYVEAPEHQLRTRNQARSRPVPDAAIDRMIQRWEVPDITEAHDVHHELGGP